jgi:hypothetical protein
MPFRTNVVTKMMLEGRSYSVFIVDNPTIDDVLMVESQLYAAEIESGESTDRRVGRDIRDLLIRLGVER